MELFNTSEIAGATNKQFSVLRRSKILFTFLHFALTTVWTDKFSVNFTSWKLFYPVKIESITSCNLQLIHSKLQVHFWCPDFLFAAYKFNHELWVNKLWVTFFIFSGVLRAGALKYVWPFYNIMHEKVNYSCKSSIFNACQGSEYVSLSLWQEKFLPKKATIDFITRKE